MRKASRDRKLVGRGRVVRAYPVPQALRFQVAELVSAVSPQALQQAVLTLSSQYRTGEGYCPEPLGGDQTRALAYLVYRFPATFVAASAVFVELARRRPELTPRSLLDVGAGPGTASLAAFTVWGGLDGEPESPRLESFTLLDQDESMLKIARELLRGFGGSAQAQFHRSALTDSTGATIPTADIAVAGYVLGEVAIPMRKAAVRQLWEASVDICVLIEPGTPAGWSSIHQATEELANLGAEILAPVPIGWPCLASEHDWLHFAARVSRSALMRSLKQADLSHEDEKFSYVIASRRPGIPYAARVIRHPQVRRGHIRIRLCSEQGVEDLVVSRTQGRWYRLAKQLQWGDAVLAEELSAFREPTSRPAR